jgi:IMP dehydrogenase
VRFLNGLEPAFDLTYDDVFMVPARSSVTSRMDVDLSCSDRSGNTIPIVVAEHDRRLGATDGRDVSRRGGLT